MRKFAKVSVVILLAAVLAWASDPWKGKPYQQWDQKDVNKVLNDSPWVSKVQVTTGSNFGSLPGNPQMGGEPMGGGAPGMGRPGGGAPGMGGQPGGNPDAGGGPMIGGRETAFEARWISSLTMREALGRLSELEGKASPASVEHYLALSPANYEIVVISPYMSAFMKTDEATLAKETYLQMNKVKTKIAPVSVKIDRTADGKRVVGITFGFPKTVNGKPSIAADENGINLVCQTKEMKLKFHFDPRKMETKQGSDL